MAKIKSFCSDRAPESHPIVSNFEDAAAFTFWESLEYYLEGGLLGAKIQNWLAGTEYWGNRLIGDNLAIVLGYFIYNKYPRSFYFSLVLSIVFLLLHLCYPSSMDIQKILF